MTTLLLNWIVNLISRRNPLNKTCAIAENPEIPIPLLLQLGSPLHKAFAVFYAPPDDWWTSKYVTPRYVILPLFTPAKSSFKTCGAPWRKTFANDWCIRRGTPEGGKLEILSEKPWRGPCDFQSPVNIGGGAFYRTVTEVNGVAEITAVIVFRWLRNCGIFTLGRIGLLRGNSRWDDVLGVLTALMAIRGITDNEGMGFLLQIASTYVVSLKCGYSYVLRSVRF